MPRVSAFGGDQLDRSNKHRAKVFYDAFYWIIKFGSFFASLLMPIFLREYGPSVAFGIPGLLMAVATVIFWAGRNRSEEHTSELQSLMRISSADFCLKTENNMKVIHVPTDTLNSHCTVMHPSYS